MNEKHRAFLLGLRELTRKHGISIDGCGCCGSPYLVDDADVSDERSGYVALNGENLGWVAPSKPSEWGAYSEDVVRPNAGEAA